MENLDLREEYCSKCASGDLRETGECFCYQYFRTISGAKKKSDLPCHGFSNTMEDEEKKNYRFTESV